VGGALFQPNRTIDLFQVARTGQPLERSLILESRELPSDADQIEDE